jgi:hypothetical protein
MSLLTIAQNVADFTGFERPSTVVGNTDPIARQLFAFINREGKQLMRSNNWPVLLKEHTFNTVNGTQSYDLPTDYDRSVGSTMYNRTDLGSDGRAYHTAAVPAGSLWHSQRRHHAKVPLQAVKQCPQV